LSSITVIQPGLTKIEPTILSPTGHDLSVLDVDAVRAVTRLIDKGYEAYLVGGCVRDLLLDRAPKDYDIATEARPPQVKRTFPRNCRIIGRRFKLAHLHFHGNTKILECSTFRRNPQEGEANSGDGDDLLITRDNEFGTAEEDALRRDFTINALFLDPTEDKIVDHVNGLADIEARVIRTIGDPVVRFREDPVRILRAAKFAGRLGFEVEEQTLAAMAETSEDLVRAAPPRVLEEILRLLRSGHALDSFQLLRDVDAIQYLVPVVGRFLENADDEHRASFWALLEALDQFVQAQPNGAEPPPNGVLLAVLMYHAVAAERQNQPTRSASSVAEDLLGSLAVDLRLPRRDSGCLKRICGVQHRFEQAENKRRFRIDAFVRSPYFEEALLLFELRTRAQDGDVDLAVVEQWHELAGTDRGPSRLSGSARSADEDDDAPRKKRRRRRRRRRADEDERDDSERNDGEREEAATAEDDSADDDSAAGDSAAGDDGPAANEHDDAEAATDEAEVAEKKKKPRRRKRSSKKVAAATDEDLSDVTFPASDEPAPHGDPMVARSGRDDGDADDDSDDETFPRDERADEEDEHEASEEVTFSDVTMEDVTFDDDEKDDDEDDDGEPRKRRRRRGRRGRGRGRSKDEHGDAAEARSTDGADRTDGADGAEADETDEHGP
jgi:poly(A) polymerase